MIREIYRNEGLEFVDILLQHQDRYYLLWWKTNLSPQADPAVMIQWGSSYHILEGGFVDIKGIGADFTYSEADFDQILTNPIAFLTEALL